MIELEDLDPASRPRQWLDVSVPWDGVFAFAARDDRFWDTEVRTKALLYLFKIHTRAQALGDGTSQESVVYDRKPTKPKKNNWRPAPYSTGKGSGGGGSGDSYKSPKGKGKKGKSTSKSTGSSSGAGASSSGSNACLKWNSGRCPSEPCPNGYLHQCQRCGSRDHTGASCPQKGRGKGK